jgi:hypothetical protein
MKNLSALCFSMLLVACDSDVTVFGGGGQGEGGTPPTGGGSPPSSGGQSSNGGASASGGASTSDGGAPTTDGGASGQGGSMGVLMGGAPPSDTIDCGMTTCDAATEQCCGTMGGASCITTGDPCQGVTLNCSSSANCTNGDVCCVSGGPGSAEASCAPACEDPPGPVGPIQLCADSAECPPGIDCVEISGFTVCDPGFP